MKLIMTLFTALLMMTTTMCAKKKDFQTIDNLDINRYLGLWYEIARYDSRFEPHDMSNVTAEYSLKENGQIRVVNSGSRNGKRKIATGRAKFRSLGENGKLKVSFFLWFFADYNVVALDTENYQYAMVAGSSFKYLWILSRTPTIKPEVLDMLLVKARSLGYDTDKLTFCEQNW